MVPGALPAAGEGAMLLDSRAVWGVLVLVLDALEEVGDSRLGVGGKE